MKKGISTILMILIIVGIIYFGKNYIDNNVANLSDTVNNALEEYYKSSDIRDINPIIELMEKNEKNTERQSEITTLVFNRIASWMTYLNNKYVCDTSNKMACTLQASEFTVLKNKLDAIYNKKTSGGDKLLSANSYNKLNSEVTRKISQINQTQNNSASSNPRTAAEEMRYKCSNASRCTDCSSSSATKCTCDYNEEKVTCPKTLVTNKIVES